MFKSQFILFEKMPPLKAVERKWRTFSVRKRVQYVDFVRKRLFESKSDIQGAIQ